MEKNTQSSLATHLIIVGQGAAPILLCPRHSQAMINMLKTADVPFAAYGLDARPGPVTEDGDSGLDAEDHLCQACDLSAELAQPRIILPD